jgi:hypothetical protein
VLQLSQYADVASLPAEAREAIKRAGEKPAGEGQEGAGHE